MNIATSILYTPVEMIVMHDTFYVRVIRGLRNTFNGRS